MARSLLEDPQFKIQFAGHETFPLRYGWLKKSYDAVKAAIAADKGDAKSVFADDSAIAYFGVGKNMVASMRHWALAAGVLEIADEGGAAGTGQIRPSETGNLMLSRAGDPYLEHPASLWLVHWHLASTPGRCTTWYWAFNEFHEPNFDRELLRLRVLRRCGELRELGRLKESRITETTIRRDVECFIRTYVMRQTPNRAHQEDNLESPLAELSLIQPVGVGGAFQFRRGPKPTLTDEVFLFGLAAFWRKLYPTRRAFSVEALAHEPGSPGRVFLLDEDSVAERLGRLPDLTDGRIRWDESTGMRQVYVSNLNSLQPVELLKLMYRRDLHQKAA